MGLLNPLAFISPIVKPTMDSLQMMKGSYRLLKQSKVFVDFSERALLDISRIELIVQSAFITNRFYRFGGRSNQTTWKQKILRLGMIVCDGVHQVIQVDLRYQVVHRIYQALGFGLRLMEIARMMPARNTPLNRDWHSTLPKVDLFVCLGSLGLRSINAYTKKFSLITFSKYFRVVVDGVSFYADWKDDPAWRRRRDILKDVSYLVKAGAGVWKIWYPEPKGNQSETGVFGRICQTLPYIIIPAISFSIARYS